MPFGNASRALGVVASHPLRMRKALGSKPSVSRSGSTRRHPGHPDGATPTNNGTAHIPGASWHTNESRQHKQVSHPSVTRRQCLMPHSGPRLPHNSVPAQASSRSAGSTYCRCMGRRVITVRQCTKGTWCSGITSASHAKGPGFKSQCVQIWKYQDAPRLSGWCHPHE